MTLRRAERVRSAASPHRFASATPTTLCRAEYAALRPGLTWSRPLRPCTLIHDIHIHSFDPTHKFEFQLFVSTIRLALIRYSLTVGGAETLSYACARNRWLVAKRQLGTWFSSDARPSVVPPSQWKSEALLAA